MMVEMLESTRVYIVFETDGNGMGEMWKYHIIKHHNHLPPPAVYGYAKYLIFWWMNGFNEWKIYLKFVCSSSSYSPLPWLPINYTFARSFTFPDQIRCVATSETLFASIMTTLGD